MNDKAIAERIYQALYQFRAGDPQLLLYLLRLCQPASTQEVVDMGGALMITVRGGACTVGIVQTADITALCACAMTGLFGPLWALLPVTQALWKRLQAEERALFRARRAAKAVQPPQEAKAPRTRSRKKGAFSVPLDTEEWVQPRDTSL